MELIMVNHRFLKCYWYDNPQPVPMLCGQRCSLIILSVGEECFKWIPECSTQGVATEGKCSKESLVDWKPLYYKLRRVIGPLEKNNIV